MEVDRKLLLEQPKGGLPDPSIKDDDGLLCLVRSYGTKDTGRGRTVEESHGRDAKDWIEGEVDSSSCLFVQSPWDRRDHHRHPCG